MQRIAANLRRTTVVGEHGVVEGVPCAWVPSLLHPVALCNAQRIYAGMARVCLLTPNQ